MTGPIFDTHAHYSARAFDADRFALLDSLPAKGVVGVCEQATHSGDAPRVLELAHRYPWVVAAIGIHPESLLPAADCGEDGPAPTVSVYGGDWAADRLVPDLVRAAAAGAVEPLRSPSAVRPWQHVLEPLGGYLLLGQRLLEGDAAAASAWNFGPETADALTVGEVAALMNRFWPRVGFRFAPPADAPHETKLLRLDCTKAARDLGWRGVWNAEECIRRTAGWYRGYYDSGRINTAADLEAYVADAARKGLSWTN